MRGDAGLLADPRARAVGADQQPRRQSSSPSASVTSMPFARVRQTRSPPSPRRSTPSAFAFSTSASTSSRFSIMCANGSPSSTSPPKVRNVGRTASSSLESVTTMSRIGCASAATASQTPIASNSRRAAAAIAEARGSFDAAGASAGSATVTAKLVAQRLAQRDRQRQAGKAAAADHHVGVAAPSSPRHPASFLVKLDARSIAG